MPLIRMFVFSVFIPQLPFSYLKGSILKIVYYLSVKTTKIMNIIVVFTSIEEIYVSAYSVNLQDKISDLLKVKAYIYAHSS